MTHGFLRTTSTSFNTVGRICLGSLHCMCGVRGGCERYRTGNIFNFLNFLNSAERTCAIKWLSEVLRRMAFTGLPSFLLPPTLINEISGHLHYEDDLQETFQFSVTSRPQ